VLAIFSATWYFSRMSNNQFMSDLARIKHLSKSSGEESAGNVLIAQMLLIVRNFMVALPEEKRVELLSADVDAIWEMANHSPRK
jgi:hypothetical protein